MPLPPILPPAGALAFRRGRRSAPLSRAPPRCATPRSISPSVRSARTSRPSVGRRPSQSRDERSMCPRSLPNAPRRSSRSRSGALRLRAALASLTVPAWLTLTSTALTLRRRAASLHSARAGDEIIVADHLDPVADRGGELLEPFIIVLGERVFDRQDRIAGAPVEQHLGQRVAIEFALLEAQTIAARLAEFRCGDVER